jgi:hypothetical protein
MKRMAWLLVAVLCSSVMLYAGGGKDKKNDAGKGKSMSMTGMVCNEKCVTTAGNKSSCNSSCSETAGDMVFVDSKGSVYKVDNQDKVSGMHGKKAKVKGSMMGKDTMHIDDIAPATY